MFSFSLGWGQEEYPFKDLLVQDFAYPDFGDNSRLGGLEALYPIGGGTALGLDVATDQNIILKRLNARLFLKQRLARRVHGIAGYETEWDMTRKTGGKIQATPFI